MNGSTESELLEAFIGEGSEAAFNELIQQHVDLVYSAAVRITGNEQLAEDAVQFVFIALAKDARSVLRKIKAGAPLSAGCIRPLATSHQNWCARKYGGERVQREAMSMSGFAMQDAPRWEEIAPHLDAAFGTLKEDQRHVLLLRFFERKTAKEIAAKMGLSEEAIQKRATAHWKVFGKACGKEDSWCQGARLSLDCLRPTHLKPHLLFLLLES